MKEKTFSLLSSQKIATGYLNSFNNEILSCKNMDDYHELIVAVFIFYELVVAQYKNLDGEEHIIDESLQYLTNAAKIIAQKTVDNVMKKAATEASDTLKKIMN